MTSAEHVQMETESNQMPLASGSSGAVVAPSEHVVDVGESVVNVGGVSVSHSSASVASRSRSPLPLNSQSNSRSRSHSHSHSRSRSRSSLRMALEPEQEHSSAATSWTHPEEGMDRERVDDTEEGKERASEEKGEVSGHRVNEEDRRWIRDVGRMNGEGGEGGRERVGIGDRGVEVIELEEGMVAGASRVEVLSVVDEVHPRVDGVASAEGEEVGEEEGLADGWHPLRENGKARLQDESESGDYGEQEADAGSAHALESIHGSDRLSDTEERDLSRFQSSGSRKADHLRLEFKPASPQPWDDVEPPADKEVFMTDYYSTLNSKKFSTMQKSRRRPLIPHSSYYFGPPPPGSAYGSAPVGRIGVHHPREIVRVERDYGSGELVQFSPVYPLELEGRITPTHFHQTINDINEILISAHSISHSLLFNFLAVFSLQLSTLILTPHYTKEMRRLKEKIEDLNAQLYNPVGLNILWPQKVAFLFHHRSSGSWKSNIIDTTFLRDNLAYASSPFSLDIRTPYSPLR